MHAQPFFIPALLFLAASLPLILGLVPLNRYYGFRTRKAMESDRAWYRINRVAGVLVALAAIFYLAVARLAPTTDRNVGFDLYHPHFYAFLGPLLLAMAATAIYARRS